VSLSEPYIGWLLSPSSPLPPSSSGSLEFGLSWESKSTLRMSHRFAWDDCRAVGHVDEWQGSVLRKVCF